MFTIPSAGRREDTSGGRSARSCSGPSDSLSAKRLPAHFNGALRYVAGQLRESKTTHVYTERERGGGVGGREGEGERLLHCLCSFEPSLFFCAFSFHVLAASVSRTWRSTEDVLVMY
jgi:hypothetical protein